MKWFVFSCNLRNLQPYVHFPNIKFNGIIAIIKSNWTPWKMTLWVFTSERGCPPAFSSTLLFSIDLVVKFMTCSDYYYSIFVIFHISFKWWFFTVF